MIQFFLDRVRHNHTWTFLKNSSAREFLVTTWIKSAAVDEGMSVAWMELSTHDDAQRFLQWRAACGASAAWDGSAAVASSAVTISVVTLA